LTARFGPSLPLARRAAPVRAAALVLVAAVLAVPLAGCSDSSSAAPTTTEDNGLPSLVLIGDSITHRSADALTAALEDRYNVTIVAEDGRTIAEQQAGAAEAAATSPEFVFINLGTNDAVKGVPLEEAEKGLVEMAAKFPDACAVFATINQNTTIPVYNQKASDLNDWLFANAPHIADWNAVVTAGYMQQNPVVLDGLHPNELGQQKYAQIISDALDECPR
jgi:lysophospholipase L1-like esterase